MQDRETCHDTIPKLKTIVIILPLVCPHLPSHTPRYIDNLLLFYHQEKENQFNRQLFNT